MKRLLAILCALCAVLSTAAADAPSPTNPAAVSGVSLSTAATEVLRLAESSIDEAIVLAYIEASQTPFDLSADDIIYLKDVGIAATFVTAMLRQDAVLQQQELQTGTAARAAVAVPQATTNAVPAPVFVTNAPPQVTQFYDSLAPYGTWVEVDGIGWCWQPRTVVIDRAWRPYWDGGRWVYTDAGWYWYSDYTWGWAPFHYGRWHQHPRCGWLWVPDLVWAPAWVCWRYSDVYCGWAPLPLGAHWVAGNGFYFDGVSVGVNFDFHLGIDFFTFVEIGHFHDHHPHLHGVPRARIGDVYRNTTVINNYAVGRNNAVINHGVPVGRVTVASSHEIHPVEIREMRADASGRIPRERLDAASGRTPVLHRPQLPQTQFTQPTRAQRIDSQHPVIAHPPIVSRERQTTIARLASSTPRMPATTPPQPQITRPHTESTPARPQPMPANPGAQPHVAPGSSSPRIAPPQSIPRTESPRGREQRLSNGGGMERVAPAPSTPHEQPSSLTAHGRDGKTGKH